jgi:DUF1365 family protein
LTTSNLLWSFASLPLVTFKILAAIHWEALRLWAKGARIVPRTKAADPRLAINDDAAYTDAGRFLDEDISRSAKGAPVR